MRSLTLVVCVASLAALATLQIFASVALRDVARPGSWMVALSPRAAARVVALADGAPLASTFHIVLARRALANGDLAAASAETRRIDAGADRFAALAALARARGDAASATRDDLAAGDLGGIDRDLDAITRAGGYAAAVALARDAVTRLATDRRQPDTLAAAWFRLGDAEERLSWRMRVGSPEREARERASYAADRRAVALAPLVERYLLGTANQALNVGELVDAERLFVRARAMDPAGADPVAGLGDVARRRGAFAEARADLARARALEPHAPAVERLARALAS